MTALLGCNPTSAGGLMGLDYLALPDHTPTGAALNRVRAAHTLEPEALTTIFSLDEHPRLRGAASLVALVQADPPPGSARSPTLIRSGCPRART